MLVSSNSSFCHLPISQLHSVLCYIHSSQIRREAKINSIRMQVFKLSARGLSKTITTALKTTPAPTPHHFHSPLWASMQGQLHSLGFPKFPSLQKSCSFSFSCERVSSSCLHLDRAVLLRPRVVQQLSGGKRVRSIGLHVISDESGLNGSEADGCLKEGEDGQSRRVQHRRKCTVAGGANIDLLTVPGIGPRNMQKLVDNGIAKVAELKKLYRDKFLGDASEKMVEFLRSSIGIVHKNHAERITSFIKESVDEEIEDETLQSGEKTPQRKRLTFCVEGNISVGKTTFLQRVANETFELRDLVEVVPEPIYKWQNIGPDHFNILDAFYAEPQRYAYTFQNYIFVTRVMQERESAGGLKPLRLMERSVFTDRMVFVRAVHEAKWMNEMELSIYDSWFDPVVSVLPGLVPDGFIYLRASPDTCHRRLQLRKRAEENTVTLEYLRGLHEKHENWLFPAQGGSRGVLSVSQLPHDMDSILHPDIRDRVVFLQGEHVHESIRKVPALVLDCEPSIDFSQDIEAKQEYARQVAEFFEFVKRKKEIQTQVRGQDTTNSKKLVVPQTGGLLGPDGKFLRPSQLNSLEVYDSVQTSKSW